MKGQGSRKGQKRSWSDVGRWLAVHRQSRAGIAAAMAARDCLWQHPVQVSHRTHTTDNGGSLAIF